MYPEITDNLLIGYYGLIFLVPVEILLISAQKALDTMDPQSTDFRLVRMTLQTQDLQTTAVIMDCYRSSGHE